MVVFGVGREGFGAGGEGCFDIRSEAEVILSCCGFPVGGLAPGIGLASPEDEAHRKCRECDCGGAQRA